MARKKEETYGRGKREPREANTLALTRTVLAGRINDGRGEGEHPVHADDIPEVQRAVFRGYRCSAGPVTRVTQRLRGRRKGETRTCSLERASLHVVYVRTCAYACATGARRRGRSQREEKGRREARDLFGRISSSGRCCGGSRSRGMYFVFGISRAEYIVYPATTEKKRKKKRERKRDRGSCVTCVRFSFFRS